MFLEISRFSSKSFSLSALLFFFFFSILGSNFTTKTRSRQIFELYFCTFLFPFFFFFFWFQKVLRICNIFSALFCGAFQNAIILVKGTGSFFVCIED